MHNECAVVTGRLWRPFKQGGGDRFLFSNLFVRRNNKWQLIEAAAALESR